MIGHTSVVCVALSMQANQMMGSWWGNQEMTEVTQGVYAARQLAMDEVRRQASEAGANDMVISTLTHNDRSSRVRERRAIGSTSSSSPCTCSAPRFALGAHEPHPAPLGAPVMSINLGA